MPFAVSPGLLEFQSFAPSVSGKLTRATLEINKAPGDDGNWTVGIRAVDIFTGQPASADLTSATIPAASIPSGDSTLTAVFPAPLQVQAGTAYALSFGSTDTFRARGQRPSVCPGIAWEFNASGPTWTSLPDLDFFFSAFVTPESPAGPSGQRDAALKKCKKKHSHKAKKKCRKKARRLPV